MRALALVALAACAAEPSVSVRVRYQQGGVDPEIQHFTEAGAWSWQSADIGYRVFDPADQDVYGLAHDECAKPIWPRDAGAPPCVVTVAIKFVPGSELDQALGVAYPNIRSVTMRAELRSFDLMAVAAHEVGHVVFHKWDHLATDEHGIMHASDQGFIAPTDDDLAWVARAESGDSGEGSVAP